MSMMKLGAWGRLARDGELRYTPSGKAVLSFTLAIDGRDDRDPTTWVKVSVWNERAEQLNQGDGLQKGTEVYVEGFPRLRSWTGSDNVQHTDLELSAYTVEPLFNFNAGKPKNQGNDANPALLGAGVGAGDSEPDDIPF